MWVQREGPLGKPIVLFNYGPRRSSAASDRLLEISSLSRHSL